MCLTYVKVWKSKRWRYSISIFIWCIIPKHPWLKRCFSCYVWLYIFMWIDFIASSSEIRVSLHFIIFVSEMESQISTHTHSHTHKMWEEQKRRIEYFNTAACECVYVWTLWSGYLQSHTKYWVWFTSAASWIQHSLLHSIEYRVYESKQPFLYLMVHILVVSVSGFTISYVVLAGKQPK